MSSWFVNDKKGKFGKVQCFGTSPRWNRVKRRVPCRACRGCDWCVFGNRHAIGRQWTGFNFLDALGVTKIVSKISNPPLVGNQRLNSSFALSAANLSRGGNQRLVDNPSFSVFRFRASTIIGGLSRGTSRVFARVGLFAHTDPREGVFRRRLVRPANETK